MGDIGGGGSSSSNTSQTANTTVNVSTNVIGPPISIAVGADLLKPVAEAFLPVARGVEGGIQTLSNQAAGIATQAQAISDFAQKSQTMLGQQQNNLALLVKLMLAVTVAGLGFQFIRTSRRAAS